MRLLDAPQINRRLDAVFLSEFRIAECGIRRNGVSLQCWKPLRRVRGQQQAVAMHHARHRQHHVALGERSREQISLHQHRSFSRQQNYLLRTFDALGGDFQIQVASEANDTSGNSERARIGVDFVDQASIELDACQRELLQRCKRRTAGTKATARKATTMNATLNVAPIPIRRRGRATRSVPGGAFQFAVTEAGTPEVDAHSARPMRARM